MTYSHNYTADSRIYIKIMKKKPQWSWDKFLRGAKRPLIALSLAIVAAWGLDVNEATAACIGLLVERVIASIEFKYL